MGATRPRQQEELLVTFLQTWPKSFKAPARAQRAALAAHMVQAVCVCVMGVVMMRKDSGLALWGRFGL